MILPEYLVLFGVYWLTLLLTYRRWPGASFIATTATLIFLFLGLVGDLGFVGDLIAFGTTLLLAIVFAVFRSKRAKFHHYLIGAVSVLGLVVATAIPRSLEVRDLLSRYHPESLVERLTPQAQIAVAQDEPPIPEDFQTNAQEIEMELQRESRSWGYHRPSALARLDGLHRVAIKVFQDSSGFGETRVRQMPIQKSLIDLPEMLPLPQPSPRPIELVTAGQQSPLEIAIPSDVTLDELRHTHVRGIANFANAAGFGYVPTKYVPQAGTSKSDLNHVVGFQPHGFRELPKVADARKLTSDQLASADSAWEVERLDLMSLLLHDPPVVYVSENVPSMGELRTSPTRSLSQFEADCLAQIREGETLVAGSTDSAIRMLGAIRATESCLQCHDVPKGRLLGAFSYVLRRTAPPPVRQLEPGSKPLS